MGELPKKHYLNWDRPLLSLSAEWLLSLSSERSLDLSDTLLLLPTQQSGRRLREALAVTMGKRGGGLFSPRMATPSILLSRGGTQNFTDEFACIWHWMHILQAQNLKHFHALFPRIPPKVDFNWCRLMARSLHDLRGRLVDAGLDCAAIASMDCCQEKGRWQELVKLESAYRKSMQHVGLIDLHDAKRELAASPELPSSVKRIILMGVTDLTPLLQTALEKIANKGITVELVVFGPPDEKGLFDDWGRPIPRDWINRKLPLNTEQLHPALDEKAQAKDITKVLKRYGSKVYDTAGVGVADARVISHLEHELSQLDIRNFNPAGEALKQSSLYAFLKSLLVVMQNPTFTNSDIFLRLPDSWTWLAGVDKFIEPTQLLAGLDELRERHIPSSLIAATNLDFVKGSESENISRRIVARSALRLLRDQLQEFGRGHFSEKLLTFLKVSFQGRKFRKGNAKDIIWREMFILLKERLVKLDAAIPTNEKSKPVVELTLLLDSIGRESMVAKRSSFTIDLQGWLELAWEDAPHLLVAGANEGVLPESTFGDRFLPERLCKELGLRSNEERFSRDAWLLELLLSVREKQGRVDFFLGRQRCNGDPLKPSRLLFRCDDAELPARVNQLFSQLAPPKQAPAWSVPWKLSCAFEAPLENLSVTSMGDYLSCPYRFFLKHVMRMQTLDIDQRELDPRGFGNLIHDVLDAYGAEKKMTQVQKPELIQQYFAKKLKDQVRHKFGDQVSLPLLVQSEVALKRLSVVAKIQADEMKQGWEIVGTEESFDLSINGIVVRGRIDRIEKNKNTGEVRVLDYKTSNTSNDPIKKHWALFNEEKHEDWVRDYARFQIESKSYRWIGLQLPLYALALKQKYPSISFGFFNIPEVGSDVGIKLLGPCDSQLLSAAQNCAEGLVADVKAGRFWPPSPKPEYEDYDSILFGEEKITAMEPENRVAR
ncbi:MAG: PD-(D/E)XK nuclease family protein [Verrucomicrobiota bacterium]|nr:PD-(D/E)XK nuclease family protein [Verrucomicrobiota bacterium]